MNAIRCLVQYEETLNVCDYEGSFERCQNDVEQVRRNLTEKLEKLFPSKHAYEIKTIDFQEFDSTNESHANAYFLYTLVIDANWLFVYAMDALENKSAS